MSNEAFLYWGMLVTVFLLLAAIVTARELLEQHLERRARRSSAKPD